jgi:hypothetical protein
VFASGGGEAIGRSFLRSMNSKVTDLTAISERRQRHHDYKRDENMSKLAGCYLAPGADTRRFYFR